MCIRDRPTAIQARQDKSAWRNLQRFTPEQLKKWRSAWEPKDRAFHEAQLSGRDLVRWKFQRYAKNYLRCIKGVDEGVGRLQETLRELDLEKNTIVIYCSDQGFYIGDHGWYDKRWMYEESLKMPFIVNWPGVTKPGGVSHKPMVSMDFFPTMLELAGLPSKPKLHADGQSLVSQLKGNDSGAVSYTHLTLPTNREV